MSRNRLLSGVLGAIYVIVAALVAGAERAFALGLFLILPLGCIWFSEAMGGYVGPVWRAVVTRPTPAVFVCIGGWLLLLLPLVVGIIYVFTEA